MAKIAFVNEIEGMPAIRNFMPAVGGIKASVECRGVPAVHPGVLELLAASSMPLTMSRIAAELGRSVSELFRMVDALVHRGYIAPADSGEGFELTNKLLPSGLVLYAFQPEAVRAEWRARLAPTVSSKVWKTFEERAATARTQKHVRADSDVTRHIVDLSAPALCQAQRRLIATGRSFLDCHLSRGDERPGLHRHVRARLP